VSEIHVIASVVEPLSQPLPPVGGFDRDPALSLQTSQQLQKRFAVVDDSARQGELAVVVDHGDE
jgi:hypothetical protein